MQMGGELYLKGQMLQKDFFATSCLVQSGEPTGTPRVSQRRESWGGPSARHLAYMPPSPRAKGAPRGVGGGEAPPGLWGFKRPAAEGGAVFSGSHCWDLAIPEPRTYITLELAGRWVRFSPPKAWDFPNSNCYQAPLFYSLFTCFFFLSCL